MVSTGAIEKKNTLPEMTSDIMESLVLNGDISKLNQSQKVQYYLAMCNRLGLDPATQPFKILKLNGKEILYADKGAAQQLCGKSDISTEIVNRKREDEVYIVTTRAKMPSGRYTDEDGAVNIAGLKGDAMANAIMKASTKSKRRAVLALCGLGMMDESEIETIPGAVPVEIVPAEKISDKQMHQIRDQLIELDVKEEKFLAHMKLDKLEDLAVADFPKAQSALEAKRKERKAQAELKAKDAKK